MWPGIWNILDGWCFGTAAEGAGRRAAALRLAGYPYAVIRDLMRGELSLRAMGLVYATLLSTIPLLAFVFALLKNVGAHRDLKPLVFDFFRPIGPSAHEVADTVLRFADSVSSGLVGTVGFAVLLWTLLGTIAKVEDSFNFVWRVELPRGLTRRITAYLGLLVIGPLLLVSFLGLTKAALDSRGVQYVAHLPLAGRLYHFGLELSPYVTVTAIFTVLYVFVPNTAVRWRPALIGAVAAGVVWAALGAAFTTLFVASARLMIVYAGFAIIVEALLWTYFGWLILLAGAQLSFYVQNPNYRRLGFRDVRLSSRELERLALAVMFLVGRSHATGSRRWTCSSLATALGLPASAVASLLRLLEAARLLATAADSGLFPARDLAGITLQSILEAARGLGSAQAAPRSLDLVPVDAFLAGLEDCWLRCCAGRTLRDLVDTSD